MTGFKAETETGVKSAFAGIGKITAGLFVVGGAVEGLKKIAEAASADQAAFASLDRTVENAGARNTIYGQSIEDVLKKQAALRGFNDEQLAGSFVRLVQATHNSEKAFNDLGLAEDLARTRHISVEQAALAISKAEQGVTTALQRLGVVVRPTTANVAALKTAHDEATAAGVKFTKQQDLQYRSMLAQAKAADQVASRQNVLATLQQRFGGSATTFANTASGAYERLREQIHLFTESLGKEALPELASAGASAAKFFGSLSQNQNLQQGIAQTLSAIKSVAQTLGPPLFTVARALGAITTSIGIPAILAGVAAFKAFTIAVNLAKAAQVSWIALQARAIGVTEAATLANQGLAASEAEVAGANAAVGVRALAGALVGMINPVTAVAVGVAGLAVGIAYLETRESALTRQNRATADSLKGLGDAFSKVRTSQRDLGDARAAIGPDKTAVENARLQVERARQALANSSAPAGSVEHAQAVLDVTTALQQQHTALQQLGRDQVHIGAVEAILAHQRKDAASVLNTNAQNIAKLADSYRLLAKNQEIAKTSVLEQPHLQEAADLLRKRADSEAARLGARAKSDPNLIAYINGLNQQAAAAQKAADDSARHTQTAKTAVAEFAAELRKLAASPGLTPLVRHNDALLAEFVTVLGRVPTRHETKIILDNKDAKASLQELVARELPNDFAALAQGMFAAGQAAMTSFADGAKIGFGPALVEVVSQFQALLGAAGAAGKKGSADQAHTAAVATAKTLANAATVSETAAKNAALGLNAARDNLTSVSSAAQDAINSAAQGVQNAQDNLAQVIANGKDQITGAVLSAKQNLSSIGQRLASDIQSFLDKQGQKAGPLTGPAAKEFAKLSDLIKHGGGTVEIERRAQALASDLEGLAAKNAQKSATGLTVQQHIDDLVGAFEKGPQNAASVKRLQTAIAKLLHVDHITRAAVAKQFGSAFADDLYAQFAAIGQQATAISKGPHRAGTGLEPSIVRPEQTVIQVNREIARAQQELGNQQLSEAKTQTEQLKLITKATQKVAAATKTSSFATTAAGKKAAAARAAASKAGIK